MVLYEIHCVDGIEMLDADTSLPSLPPGLLEADAEHARLIRLAIWAELATQNRDRHA